MNDQPSQVEEAESLLFVRTGMTPQEFGELCDATAVRLFGLTRLWTLGMIIAAVAIILVGTITFLYPEVPPLLGGVLFGSLLGLYIGYWRGSHPCVRIMRNYSYAQHLLARIVDGALSGGAFTTAGLGRTLGVGPELMLDRHLEFLELQHVLVRDDDETWHIAHSGEAFYSVPPILSPFAGYTPLWPRAWSGFSFDEDDAYGQPVADSGQ